MSKRRKPVRHVACDGEGCKAVVVSRPEAWTVVARSWHDVLDLCPRCAVARDEARRGRAA